MIVQPIVETVDDLTLAGPVGAVDENHDGGALLLRHFELGVEKLLPKRRLQGLERLFGHDMWKAGGFEHGGPNRKLFK